MYSPSVVLNSFLRDLSPFQKFSLTLRLIVVILYILASLIQYNISQIGILPTSPAYQTFKYIFYSLNTPPLTSLYIIPSLESCPENSSDIILANWVKTPEACSSESLTSHFLDDYADDPLTTYGNNFSTDKKCIQSVEALYVWKSYKFCAERLQNFLRITSTDTCPEGFIRCYKELCVSQMEQCPITNINLVYSENQSQIEDNKEVNTTPLLKVKRSLDDDPIFALEVSIKPKSCNKIENYFNEKEWYQLQECDSYGEDTDAEVIDSERIEEFLGENNQEIQILPPSNSTNLNLDSMSFLITRKSLIRESTDMIVKPDLKIFEERFTVLKNLEAISIAFGHTEFIMFAMLFCLKHKILTNLLLLYCFVQLFTGIYIIILISSFGKIQVSNTYLFLKSLPAFSNDMLNLSISDIKNSLDHAHILLGILSVMIIVFSLVKLIVFLAFTKLQKRWINQPGSGPTVLDINSNHEAMGMLIGLLPVAGEHVDRNQLGDGRDVERGEIELETMSSQGEERNQR